MMVRQVSAAEIRKYGDLFQRMISTSFGIGLALEAGKRFSANTIFVYST